MNLQEYLESMRMIESDLLDIIKDEENFAENIGKKKVKILKITECKEKFKSFLYLVSNISENHHRVPNFHNKIEQILLLLKDEIKKNFENEDIFHIFKRSKRILLFLFQEQIITMNEMIATEMSHIETYIEYFSPEIKYFLKNEKIIDKYPEDYNEKRLEGENDNYICKLIRNDSVEEFIIYMTKQNYSPDSIISPSIYETNPFLLNHNATLIEYSAFFGSIQIFRYLKYNKAKLRPSIWLYCIHSNNPEMIHLLEENEIKPKDQTFNGCIKESIKCHHNEIAHYIEESLQDFSKDDDNKKDYDDENECKNDDLTNISFRNEVSIVPFHYYNFEFFPNKLCSSFMFILYLCNNQNTYLAKLYLKDADSNFIIFDINDYEVLDKLKVSCSWEVFMVKNKSSSNRLVMKTSKNNHDKFIFEYLDKCIINKYPALFDIKGYSPLSPEMTNYPTILMDYYQNGTLDDYLSNNKKNKKEISNTEKYILILGIAIGIKYLHQHKILNQNFTPSNILIDDNFYPVISDYLRQLVYNVGEFNNAPNNEMNIIYFSPEFIESDFISFSSNTYTYSIIIYQIITGKNPFNDKLTRGLFRFFRYIVDGYRPDLSSIENEYIRDFLSACWNSDPAKRLKFEEIIDCVTNEEFYSFFEPLEYEAVKDYLDIFGDEYNHLKGKFES